MLEMNPMKYLKPDPNDQKRSLLKPLSMNMKRTNTSASSQAVQRQSTNQSSNKLSVAQTNNKSQDRTGQLKTGLQTERASFAFEDSSKQEASPSIESKQLQKNDNIKSNQGSNLNLSRETDWEK